MAEIFRGTEKTTTKTPADRGKSVNGGQGDVIFRWELPQSEPDGSASSLMEGA